MKKNDFVQIKGLDIKELMSKAKELKLEISNLVMDKNMKKTKDLKTVYKKRKDLAQVLTIARQKELLVKLETKISDAAKQKEVVMDNSTVQSKSKKKGKTEVSKKE